MNGVKTGMPNTPGAIPLIQRGLKLEYQKYAEAEDSAVMPEDAGPQTGQSICRPTGTFISG